nr:MAG TPA: hypothetical protein [Caudoviricetes sp.]
MLPPVYPVLLNPFTLSISFSLFIQNVFVEVKPFCIK